MSTHAPPIPSVEAAPAGVTAEAVPALPAAPMPRFVGPGFITAFLAVAVAGFSQAATTADALVPRSSLPALAAGCALYTLLGTAALSLVERRGTRGQLQLLIGALLALGVVTTLASHGYAAMLLLGVVSVGVLHLPPRGSWLVTGLATAAALAAFAQRAPLWSASLQAEIAFGSAIAFVFVFSRIARREHRARGQIERLVAELAGANARLTAEAEHVEQLAGARERNRIAREIHDGLGHYLTVVHIQLEAARTYLASDPDRARAALDRSQQLTRDGLGEVRRSVALLRDRARPLLEALAELANESTAAGIATRLRVDGAPRRLAEPIEHLLYRAAQEALTNARRHARASRVEIVVGFADPASVRLGVEDDGLGARDPSEGFGLQGMRERAELAGGTLAITTGPDRGFALALEVPA